MNDAAMMKKSSEDVTILRKVWPFGKTHQSGEVLHDRENGHGYAKVLWVDKETSECKKRDELTQKANYEAWHADTDPEKLLQMTERMNSMDCVSNVNEEIKLTARKAYQNMKQGSFSIPWY
jgi:hypothetical protein